MSAQQHQAFADHYAHTFCPKTSCDLP